MKPIFFLVACLFATSFALAEELRNPFEPVKVTASKKTTAPAQIPPPLEKPSELPPLILPPPAPEPPPVAVPKSAPAPAAKSGDGFVTVEAPEKPAARTKSRDPASRIQASCSLKTKVSIIAAPAAGGAVTLPLQVSGGRECLSAVLAEQSWLEVKDISDPSAVRLLVDANDAETPRQSNIVVANAGQSVTVVLMQEGRMARGR